jgi:hypothetical protein
MYNTLSGQKLASVIISCMILSRPIDSSVQPMRLAAPHQLIRAAIRQAP